MTELEGQYFEAPAEISGQELRTSLGAFFEGINGSTELLVTAGVAARTVDVSAGVGYVQGDSVTDQGRYRCRNDAAKNSAAFELGGIPAAGANPRLDQIVARVYDHTHDGSNLRKWRLEVIAGVATPGATLDNRSGAAALPASALRLADVLITNDAVIGAGAIRNRCLWARGAFWRGQRTAGDIALTTSYAELDTTNLKPRLELSGLPVRVTLLGTMEHSNAGSTISLRPQLDGAAIDSISDLFSVGAPGAGYDIPFSLAYVFTPAAGSHQIAWAGKVTANTGTIFAAATRPLTMTVEEIPRLSGSN